jgi:hypothetical protein
MAGSGVTLAAPPGRHRAGRGPPPGRRQRRVPGRHGPARAGRAAADPVTGQLVAAAFRARLLNHVRPALSDLGDTETITGLLRRLDDRGTGADRQRALFTSGLSAPAFITALARATLSAYEPGTTTSTKGLTMAADPQDAPRHAGRSSAACCSAATGAGNDRAMSTATASSFLNTAGKRAGALPRRAAADIRTPGTT